ncbi:MAG TPA: type VI immunity family protein [Archangium sp.]|uniref:type VI immunity family protein n=1 Tax=Archangium sp. TaxID=1872627 RepID=UPI002ED9445F
MTERYPRIRHYGPTPVGEQLLLRDVVRIAFFMPHDNHELAPGVEKALDVYRRGVGVGPGTICHGWDAEGENDQSLLEEKGWQVIRSWLHPSTTWRFLDEFGEETEFFRRRTKKGHEVFISLTGAPSEPTGYGFTYCARLPWRTPPEHSVSVLSATLPTEYLEEHGSGRGRELALEMASHLRFSTGHAGLAFDFFRPHSRLLAGLREEVFRYPGLDVPDVELLSAVGTRVAGVHWLNFLSQPVLGALGGAAALRTRLHSPETTLHELDGERVVVTLGQWPEAGDLARGQDLPAYRELARVLEPWLESFSPSYANTWRGYTQEEVRRWWRRFLD